MKKFTNKDFIKLKNSVGKSNRDLSRFIVSMETINIFSKDEIDEILDYMRNCLKIRSDYDFYSMNIEKRESFIHFTNIVIGSMYGLE